jgi:16S rRNA (guanine527-N7)-methyltransferase
LNRLRELRAGIEQLELMLFQSQIDQLIQFLFLLEKWNQNYNLTAIRGVDKMLSYHLLDSLSIMPAISGSRKILDVGSGAGLPGIPLAIAMPESDFVLVDSNNKKTRFIQQALAHCGIKNVQVVQSRIEVYDAPDSFDFIISRAYASLSDFYLSVAHLMNPPTRLLTMKTELTETESALIDASKFTIEEQILNVPGIKEMRSQVILRET